jgi:hypothetical protein
MTNDEVQMPRQGQMTKPKGQINDKLQSSNAKSMTNGKAQRPNENKERLRQLNFRASDSHVLISS